MSKSKKSKLNIDTSGLEGLSEELTNMTKKLETELKPLMDLNNLESEIEKLKDSVAMASKHKNTKEDNPYPDREGDTCMHGNAWNSNCAECDAFDVVDAMMDIVKTTPNDKELGSKIRQFAKELEDNT